VSCDRLQVGDKGQRFEIRYIDETGAEKVMGWAPTRDGADGMARAMALAPYVRETSIIDRNPPTDSGLDYTGI
jgi:hypothetical protein